MGHHLIFIPRKMNSYERSEVSDVEDEETKHILVMNLQDSKIQKIKMPLCMNRGNYLLVKYKENQMVKIEQYMELITIESFERKSIS